MAKPSEANARALADLFPATKKHKFDVWGTSVNAQSQRKKKAAFPRKGRAKSIRVVMLDANPDKTIPRGARRESLKQQGRIKDVPFIKYISFDEVKSLIQECFSLSCEFRFLRSLKDNTLCTASKQALDGSEVIDLAGHGSLYLEQLSPVSLSPPTLNPTSSLSPTFDPPTSSFSNALVSVNSDELTSREREVLSLKADAHVAALKVGYRICLPVLIELLIQFQAPLLPDGYSMDDCVFDCEVEEVIVEVLNPLV